MIWQNNMATEKAGDLIEQYSGVNGIGPWLDLPVRQFVSSAG
jgi:hypothetical protein